MAFFVKQVSAFKGYAEAHTAHVDHETSDPLMFLNNMRQKIASLLTDNRLRFIICLVITFVKYSEDSEIYRDFYFCSFVERITSAFQINEKLDMAFEKILHSIENFVRYGSGWIINTVKHIDVHIGKYNSISGGCYNIELPSFIKKKKCMLNIKCKDNLCFVYCILAKLYPSSSNKNVVSSYKKYLKYIDIKKLFPVTLDSIKYFEKRNNLSINVYSYDSEVFPIYVSKKRTTKINLFLYKNHFFLITNFNRLMNTKNGIHYFCPHCMVDFQRQNTLRNHKKICYNNKFQKLSMPNTDNSVLHFNAMHKMVNHEFCVYADFECLTKKLHTVVPSSSKSFTTEVEEHQPINYALVVINNKNGLLFHKYYVGIRAVKNFRVLKKVSHCILKQLQQNIPLLKVSVNYNKNTACHHICKKPFISGEKKILDHDHYSGKFSGFAHQACNLHYKNTYFVPIVIHNLSGYDSHLILKNISKNVAKEIKIIPVSMEKFTTFTLDKMEFIDSFNFLATSLSNLVQNLNYSKYDFPIFNTFF